ncbi:MAG: DUF2808 domain-containing protein [Nostocaceae cyanobacterium]|nr:DUF2808 domain-containing protein [Nostocaceae cyanobacterium]
MKKLLLSALPLLLIVSAAVPSAHAADYRRDTKATQIVSSGAIPNDANITNYTHYFAVKVQGNELSQLTIDFPEDLMVTDGIRVTDNSGKKVEAKVNVNNKQATIEFSQPVAVGTTLKIALQGVTDNFTTGHARTWLYPVNSRSVGFQSDIPLGLVHIQSYEAF